MATVLWRSDLDVAWTTKHDITTVEQVAEYSKENNPIRVRPGRLYRGVPYSFSGNPACNFYRYFSGKDEKGYPIASGIHWRALNGGSKSTGRIGNDCSGSIHQSWQYVGGNFIPVSTAHMTAAYGYIPVGNYKTDPERYEDTTLITAENGSEVMYKAYTQLQKADAVVYRRDGAGHTMMFTGMHVVNNTDGTIDGEHSYITVLHQTSKYLRSETCEYDDTLGEDVYQTYGIDDQYTFTELYETGYLPVTCDILTDPDAKPKEIWFKDSETEYTKDNIFGGTFTSNGILAYVTVTVNDESGNEVGKRVCFCKRQSKNEVIRFYLSWFETEPDFLKIGSLDLAALTPGTYHCTHVLTDGLGGEHVIRDFEFTV